jgi:hypothetical protein
MSLEEALSSPNPVSEIAIRITHKPYDSMSEPEKVFWSVCYFVGDTLNGGLDQSLTNETGALMPLFAEFAKRYGSAELVTLVEQIARLFSSSEVPAAREERCQAMATVDPDTLDRLTEAFHGCEQAIDQGLIALARNNAARFDLSGKA